MALWLNMVKYGVLEVYWRVPGIALPPDPVIPYPGYTLTTRLVRRQLPDMLSTQTKYDRGAHIRRTTHFKCPDLAYSRVYRGL